MPVEKGPGRPHRRYAKDSRALILEVLRGYKRNDEPLPTVDEIARRVELSKTATQHHLQWLQAHGVIEIGTPVRAFRILIDESASETDK